MVRQRLTDPASPRQQDAPSPTGTEKRNGVAYTKGLPDRPDEVSGPVESRNSLRLERWLLKQALGRVGNPPIAIELWDGTSIGNSQEGEPFRIRIKDRPTLWKILQRPQFEFAEGYVADRIQTDGPLVDLTTALLRALQGRQSLSALQRLLGRPAGGSRSRSAARRNVHHHYDLGNEFYRLWLDECLVYTCAYFESEEASLETAQVAKMDHICRKVRLQPGDRVVEAGCGWGALALHMAGRYGAQVTAYNISREQLQYARQQARQAGLDDRVTFVEEDWRAIRSECDVFVSVGMLEHVGPENCRRFGEVINRCLVPDGRGLIHSIGLNRQRPLHPWTVSRIFPGAQPPTLGQATQIFEPHDMSVLDVENLRRHYALTLRHWLRRFEESSAAVSEMFDDRFVRMWRMYLAASVSAFETGWLQLYQILFAKGANNAMPLTRQHMYGASKSG